MTEPEHSPLPWSRDRDDRILDADGNRIGRFSGAGVLVDEHNARLVIAAANSRATLLAAAKLAVGQMDQVIFPIAREKLKAAIAAAEEQAP